MVSITTWTRLEPRCRDATLQDGLEARLHDPLWMLARQWQLGEFAAHDGGSPAEVRLGLVCAPLSRYRPAVEGADAHPYDPRALPLEAVVEREQEQLSGPGPDLRAAAEAGLHFARLLRHHDAGHYVQTYRDRYPLAALAGGNETPLGDDGKRFLAVMGNRAFDGVGLYQDLAGLPRAGDGTLERLPDEPAVANEDREAVAAAAGRWLAWYEDTHRAPALPPAAWSTERMTHAFSVSAVTRHDEVALTASEHPGGRLDWDAFDHAPDLALRDGDADPDDTPAETAATVLPARVRYRGMPTSRWWELEDAGADLGRVASGPEDLARLVFVELAVTYGNDWFLAPVDVDVGSLAELRSVVVTDTFGRRTLIRHHADVDGPDGRWRMFGLSAPADHPARRMLLLPPTLPAGQRGPALEEVLLRRDELANLAWAVERTVPSRLGTPVDRRGVEAGGPDERGGTPETGAPFVYRSSTDVPEHWFPLVAVRGPEPGRTRLVRGRMPADEGEQPPEPRGALLRAAAPLVLLDEAVPRAGARLARREERGRWSDGSTPQWRARRRQRGGGEAWSGLRHDVVEPAEPTEPDRPDEPRA